MARDSYTTDLLYRIMKRVYNMRIAICDDEILFINSLRTAVNTYSNMHRLEFAVDSYLCGEELLKSKVTYDIIIMDYKMEEINGLETARILRERNLNCAIIFLTNFPHFVYESFEVSTFRFFEKPLDTEKLYKAFDDYFEKFGNNYPIVLSVNRDKVCIQTNDIVYLEASNKNCYVNLVKGRYHCAKTMAAVSQLLPKNIFFKVNKAYIINFNFVCKYDNETVYFKNGAFAYISRKYLTPFKYEYKKFVKGRVL